MNAKKCKKLRKLVRQRGPNQPPVEYQMHKQTGVIRLRLDSQRGMYQNFKKYKVLG